MLRFGRNSMLELQGVRAELVVMCSDIQHYVWNAAGGGLDFSVFEGLRDEATQRRYVRSGVSWTMNSKHLPQSDGLAWAVDLVPYLNGRLWWESPDDQTMQDRIDKTFSLIHQGAHESALRHDFKILIGYEAWGKDKPHIQLEV